MKLFKNTICAFSKVLALTLLLVSCIADEPMTGKITTTDEVRVKFYLQVPRVAPRTYAMTPADESEITIIDVLAFRADADKPSGWAFTYNVQGKLITDTDMDEDEKKQARKQFTVSLKKDSGQQTFVILANVRDEIDELRGIAEGVDKEVLLSRLLSCRDWQGNAQGSDFIPFPMWGEVTTTVDDFTKQIGTVSMLRSVARVDVVLGEEVVADSKFRLNGVYLYNSKSKGHIVPALSAIDNGKIVSATIPQGEINRVQPLFYDVPSAMNTAFVRSVYLYEAKAVEPGESAKATAIVVGGTYGTDEEPTYYRLDFFKSDMKTGKDILRNYLYRFNIINVTGRGYETAEEAFKSKPVNIEAEVLEWNEDFGGDIVFDGQYFLSVNPAEHVLSNQAKTENGFAVMTDVPEGWKITGVTDSPDNGGGAIDWIGNVIVLPSGLGNKSIVLFDVDENTLDLKRTGYIHIVAGRLRFAVKVIQRDVSEEDEDVRIEVYDTDAVTKVREKNFTSMAGMTPAVETINLKWYPPSAEVYIRKQPSVEGLPEFVFLSPLFALGEGNLASVIDVNGVKMLSVCPLALTPEEVEADPFVTRESNVIFTVFSENRVANQNIILRHFNYYTLVDVADSYLLNGSNYTFTIRSNTEWVVKKLSVDDPDSILDNSVSLDSQQGGYNTSTGNTFNFKLINDENGMKDGKTASFVLTDPSGRMNDITVTIKGVSCGMKGVAMKRKIGSKSYLTHQYGGRCWMVENSKEGTATATYYGQMNRFKSSDYGQYYYAYANANTACPKGWHLPSVEEFEDLKADVRGDSMKTIGKWWGGNSGKENGAFCGCKMNALWIDWGEQGYWWTAEEGKNFDGNENGIGYILDNPKHWFSVRCVQD